MYEQKFLAEMKNDLRDKLLTHVANVLFSNKIEPITSPTYFTTRLDTIVLLLLERAGSGVPKAEEELLINSWRSLMSATPIEVFIHNL